MNHQDLAVGLKRLERNYRRPDKEVLYTNDQKDILWDKFKTTNISPWNQIIEILIDTCTYLPTTDKFMRASKELARDDAKRDVRLIHEECSVCDGLGLKNGIFEKYGKLFTAVARCSCNNSENHSKIVPTAAMVERNEDSGLLEWVTCQRLPVRMDELRQERKSGGE